MTLVFKCKNCGREFTDKPSKRRVYCSKKCHDEAQTTGPEVECEVCGKKFHKTPSKTKWKRNFCGNECRLKWLSEYCRTEVNVPGHSKGHKAPHLAELNRTRNPLLALEPDAVARGSYKTKEHRRAMEEIIGRKLKPNEDVHHINGIHDDNRPENLMVINHSEHMKLHWRIAKEKGVI